MWSYILSIFLWEKQWQFTTISKETSKTDPDMASAWEASKRKMVRKLFLSYVTLAETTSHQIQYLWAIQLAIAEWRAASKSKAWFPRALWLLNPWKHPCRPVEKALMWRTGRMLLELPLMEWVPDQTFQARSLSSKGTHKIHTASLPSIW